jgi:hypothetical protein
MSYKGKHKVAHFVRTLPRKAKLGAAACLRPAPWPAWWQRLQVRGQRLAHDR